MPRPPNQSASVTPTRNEEIANKTSESARFARFIVKAFLQIEMPRMRRDAISRSKTRQFVGSALASLLDQKRF